MAFNEAYFSTAATVIPVLLLAVVLQNSFIIDVVKLSMRWRREGLAERLPPLLGLCRQFLKREPIELAAFTRTSLRSLRGMVKYLVSQVLGIACALVLIYGVAGEYSAMVALRNQHAASGDASRVMDAMLALLVAFIATFVFRLERALLSDRKSGLSNGEGRSADTSALAAGSAEGTLPVVAESDYVP